MTIRTLFLESYAGIAGDMFTSAFLDAGLVEAKVIQDVPRLLGAEGVTVEVRDTQKANARFKTLRVVTPAGPVQEDHHHVGDGHHHHGHDHDHDHGHHHHHHHYGALIDQLEDSELDPVAKEFALRVFHLLAEAEADSHGVPIEKVAFHEVGAIDSVVDVAMAGVCLATVAPDRVLATPIKLGRGTIKIQHGTYPVPPPASARLAVGMPVAPVPPAIESSDIELSTPTGLAILKALNPEFVEEWPAGTLAAQGSGAGTRDLGEYPNVFRVALFEESSLKEPTPGGPEPVKGPDQGNEEGGPASGSDAFPYETDTVVEIRCNVDDQTGERTAWLMEKGLEYGALDGWVTPAVGKKGRPTQLMAFLVNPEDVTKVSDLLLRYSSTFGVRYAPFGRFKLARKEEVRETPHGPVSFKIGMTREGEKLKEKAEFDDMRKVWETDPDA